MRARTGLWEPRVGNDPGPPGRILIPENHATLGNSGVCRISNNESWVTCGEGLLRLGKRKEQTNKVLFVKITVGQ
jgi:hypothetical protein